MSGLAVQPPISVLIENRHRSCLIRGPTDLKLEPEAIPEAKEPPAYWPTKEAKIEVEDLTCAYAPELPPVLKGVSFVVQPGERVGVCGRTGEQRLLKCIKSACLPNNRYFDAIGSGKSSK